MSAHATGQTLGDSSTVELRTLTPSILVRIQVPQPLILLHFLFFVAGRSGQFRNTFGEFRSGFELADSRSNQGRIFRQIVFFEDSLRVVRGMAGDGNDFRLGTSCDRKPGLQPFPANH